MPHVSAFSRPQTVPPPTGRAEKESLDSEQLAGPHALRRHAALLVPMFALAQTRWSAQDIYLFVAAFGAIGHHLPGMIRAYGDRALFERFKWRFIFAPIFLVASAGVQLVGSERARARRFLLGRLARHDADLRVLPHLRCENRFIRCPDRRLDFATCAIWFAAAVLLSRSE